MRHLQHPLVVLLLVVAGARLDISFAPAALVVGFVVFRMAGKLGGGRIARAIEPRLPRGADVRLLPPGLVGIALAVDALQAHAGDPAAETILAVVVAGSLVAEAVALFAVRTEVRA